MSDENFPYPDPNAIVYPVQIPFWGSIAGGVHVGKLIEIKGSVPYGTDVFDINLVTGSDPTSDRALHISVRFHNRTVVRNSLERNQWGTEERDGNFPFSSGREFKLLILVEQNAYRIAVDTHHCFEFRHRIPISRVNTIFINGSVHIDRIEYVNKATPYQPGTHIPFPPVGFPDAYPSGAILPGQRPGTGFPSSGIGSYPISGQGIGTCVPPLPGQGIGTCVPPLPGQGISTYVPGLPGQRLEPGITCIPSGGLQPSSNLAPVYNPSIPYAYPIYGGLKPGMMIYVSGRPSASAYRFSLNLQCGTSPYPPPDIAFHFDARFFNSSVVRNTRTNDNWGTEEFSAPFFPFQHGVNFDLIIRVESDRFMVALNGQHFAEYKFRLWPLSRIDTLSIEDDIVVSSIRFA